MENVIANATKYDHVDMQKSDWLGVIQSAKGAITYTNIKEDASTNTVYESYTVTSIGRTDIPVTTRTNTVEEVSAVYEEKWNVNLTPTEGKFVIEAAVGLSGDSFAKAVTLLEHLEEGKGKVTVDTVRSILGEDYTDPMKFDPLNAKTWLGSVFERGSTEFLQDAFRITMATGKSLAEVNMEEVRKNNPLEDALMAMSTGGVKSTVYVNKTKTSVGTLPRSWSEVDMKNAETYYRTMSSGTMSSDDYNTLVKTGKMPPSRNNETFTSPTREFSENYDGVLVEFKLKSGTTSSLESIGVRDTSKLTLKEYSDLPLVYKGWSSTNSYFKKEGNQINIGLGNGRALDIFNENVLQYKAVRGGEK